MANNDYNKLMEPIVMTRVIIMRMMGEVVMLMAIVTGKTVVRRLQTTNDATLDDAADD